MHSTHSLSLSLPRFAASRLQKIRTHKDCAESFRGGFLRSSASIFITLHHPQPYLLVFKSTDRGDKQMKENRHIGKRMHSTYRQRQKLKWKRPLKNENKKTFCVEFLFAYTIMFGRIARK